MSLYIVDSDTLTSIANAIRKKTGKNLKLTFPQDYIQEINKITSIALEHDFFEGNYILTPSINSQIIETKNKIMEENITIKEIPYYDVSNSFGRTIIIGGE